MKCITSSGAVTGAANKTMISVLGIATRRPRLRQVIIGLSGAASDAMALFYVRRITADGTGTANANVFACDISDGTPVCTSKVNYTVEPTYATGNYGEIPLHYRATAVWNAPEPEGLGVAIGTANGWGIQMSSSTALAYNITLIFDE